MRSSLTNPGKCHTESLKTGYYDRGFGVNEAEALRQDLIVELSLAKIEKDRDNRIDKMITRLAYLAGARMLSGREAKLGGKDGT